MNKVFITKASTHLIFKGLRKLQDSVSKENTLIELESDFKEHSILPNGGFDRYFNLSELRNLYKMKMLLKDLSTLIEKMGDNKDVIAKYIESANNRFVKEIKAPSYHTYDECKWLKSNFYNLELPKSIKDKEMIKKMKSFINQFSKNQNFKQTNILYKKEFNTTEDLIDVNLANSGIEDFDNEQIITDLFAKIQKEFDDMHSILHSQKDNTINKKIKNIVYADIWKMDSICKNSLLSEQDCIDIKKILETKKMLTETLYTFYREKYNKNLTFEENILDSIGFRICKGCDNQDNASTAA